MTTPPEFRAAIARQVFETERLFLEADVSLRIRRGAANQRDVYRLAGEVEDLVTVQREKLHQVIFGRGVHLGSFDTRIHEGLEPYAGYCACLATSDVAVEVDYHAFRKVVGLDLVLGSKSLDLWDQPEVTADHALE